MQTAQIYMHELQFRSVHFFSTLRTSYKISTILDGTETMHTDWISTERCRLQQLQDYVAMDMLETNADTV